MDLRIFTPSPRGPRPTPCSPWRRPPGTSRFRRLLPLGPLSPAWAPWTASPDSPPTPGSPSPASPGETKRIRLGALMTASAPSGCPASSPSGRAGRPDVRAAGSSWAWAPAGFEEEHKAYGIPFPGRSSPASKNSWRSSPVCGPRRPSKSFDFHGKFYDLTESPALPKPARGARSPCSSAATVPSARPAGRPVRRRVQHPLRLSRSRTPGASSAGSRPPPRRGRRRGRTR